MTATDELKALLNERNVEYKDRDMFGKHVFHWGEPLHGAMFTASLSDEWTELVVENPTPQQAIDATLGRGECEVYEDEASIAVFGVKMEYKCCECETSFVAWKYDEYDDQIDVKPTFCPNCGSVVKR